MLRTEAAHGDRLHAASPTVVAQGHARDTVQGIGHVSHSQCEHLLTVDDMQGGGTRHHMLPSALRHRHFLKLMGPVRHGVVTDHLRVHGIRQQEGRQEHKEPMS